MHLRPKTIIFLSKISSNRIQDHRQGRFWLVAMYMWSTCYKTLLVYVDQLEF